MTIAQETSRATLGERLTIVEFARIAKGYAVEDAVQLVDEIDADAKLATVIRRVFAMMAGSKIAAYEKRLALEDRIAELEKQLDGSAERSTPPALVAGRAS